MKIGFSCGQKHYCFLCDYYFSEADFETGRLQLREHFRNVHHRTMVAENCQQKGSEQAIEWTGPVFKNDETVGSFRKQIIVRR